MTGDKILRARALDLVKEIEALDQGDTWELTSQQEQTLAIVRSVCLDLVDLCIRTGLDEQPTEQPLNESRSRT